ncbi:transposase family protein [Streptomyces sp. NBC_01549]|uniref:transposase family protein n=1 Tax=Streptomyces sp. NBC_01549 TaxID=2975874 RepID=UPI00224D8FB6|nr:transposase family protein [Streptomyces sp. NBC_01549]MCX4593638.1 transposase family protein [Streptomyces sp. NBC_01549]
MVQARTRSPAPAGCTACGTLSQWIYSRYVRHVSDVAIGSRPVRIELSVRRLYCENSACPKVTLNWRILRDCRLKGDGVHQAVLGIARLHNLALTG